MQHFFDVLPPSDVAMYRLKKIKKREREKYQNLKIRSKAPKFFIEIQREDNKDFYCNNCKFRDPYP